MILTVFFLNLKMQLQYFPKSLQDGTEITVFNKDFTEIGSKLAAQIPTTGVVSYKIPQCNEDQFLNYMKFSTPSQICGLIFNL